MYKYLLGIEGMGCEKCEMLIRNAIESNIEAIKVKASHINKQLLVITELELTREDFVKFLSCNQYNVISFEKNEAKKSLFGWR